MHYLKETTIKTALAIMSKLATKDAGKKISCKDIAESIDMSYATIVNSVNELQRHFIIHRCRNHGFKTGKNIYKYLGFWGIKDND
tara:strand:+ start:786 stop:1040 length:255 start_codon:yes stop_codon:yes gene_type:complete